MNQQKTEPTVTGDELKKSIESLMALLETEDASQETVQEAVEKSMVSTEGGLADQAGVPPLNPELDMGGQELLPDGSEGDDLDTLVREQIARMSNVTQMEKSQMNKSQAVDNDAAAEEPEEAAEVQGEGAEDTEADAFAKSLADAFVEQEAVAEAAAQNEFAKSLVLGTIEGLSIAHEEMNKSLAEMENRQDAKIAILAKGLAAIAKAVDEIRTEVVRVSNAPVRPMAKSATSNVQVLEKSFAGQGSVDSTLLKSKVMGALEQRVQAGKLDAFQLVRYETTGVLDPALAKDIQSELGL